MRALRRALAALDRHWFGPASRRDLGIVRVAVMLFTLASLLALPRGLYLAGALTWGGQQLRLSAPAATFAPIPALKVLMWPFGWGVRPEPMFIHGVWLLAVAATILALVGYATRVALLTVAATASLLIAHFYSYQEMHHPEAVLVMTLWLLALGPRTGFSLDTLRERVRDAGARASIRTEAARADIASGAHWPLRTVQWLFFLVYLSAGVSKLANGGFDWLNGYTLTYYFLDDGIHNHIPIALWLSDKVLLARILSMLTLVFELTFAVAVLVPSTSWLYAIVGIGIHTGIYLTQRAPFFTFIVLYVVFLPQLRQNAAGLRAAWARWRARLRAADPSLA